MKKSDLAQRLAERSKLTPAEAADRLDRVVHSILKKLRRGKGASLPGLGKITPGHHPPFSRKAGRRSEPAREK